MAAAALPVLISLALQALPAIVTMVEQAIPQANGIAVKLPVATKLLTAFHNALVDAGLASGPAPDLTTVQTAISSTVSALKTAGALQPKDAPATVNATDTAHSIVLQMLTGAASILKSTGTK